MDDYSSPQKGPTQTHRGETKADYVAVRGLPVAGYKPTQPQWAVDLVTSFKQDEERILRKIDALRNERDPETGMPVMDPNWLFEGRRMVELGFMMINRSVFKPGRVTLPEDAVERELPELEQPEII